MNNKTTQSVEVEIAHLANSWLSSYGIDKKMENVSLNREIDYALQEYVSKRGGNGGNRPDAKCLLYDKMGKAYPILIEYKGHKDKLVYMNSHGQVDNKKDDNTIDLSKINSYAVNGAVHYANAILHFTCYSEVIAIGMTGYKEIDGTLQYEIGVYYVSKDNLGIGQEVGKYNDFSFLSNQHFDEFIDKIHSLSMTPQELEWVRSQREAEIVNSLKKLNNDIYHESGLGVNDRVYLVASTVIVTMGVYDSRTQKYSVAPLDKSALKSLPTVGLRDGDIIKNYIETCLNYRGIPNDKKDIIVNTLSPTLTNNNYNTPQNGESQIRRVFCNIYDDLGIYYKTNISTDFTGKLFNEMYSWLGFYEDVSNDVVLTPSYVCKLLVKLAKINRDSYVWDFATGSGGLLVAAMNEMIDDAKANIESPQELTAKISAIKANQLLGLEVLPNIYMLAMLNMIMMGDGSSNLINEDSLYYDGKYRYGNNKDTKFKADALILNPPYSKYGNGMWFAEKAFDKMEKGYGAIIIQASAGSGKATDYNKRILKRNTLLASIKMPLDLFCGKSGVQTYIYVFRIGERHEKDNIVKFIDFSNDGYKRTSRKKANNNIQDIGNAPERYNELVKLVHFGKQYLNLLTQNEYFEDTIDPNSGKDWNKTQSIELLPTADEFQDTVKEYLAWKVCQVVVDQRSCKQSIPTKSEDMEYKSFRIEDLFIISSTKKKFNANNVSFGGIHPYVVRTSENNGIKGYIDEDEQYLNDGGTISLGQDTATIFYQEEPFFTGDKIKILTPKFDINTERAAYIITCMRKSFSDFQWGATSFNESILKAVKIKLPVTKEGKPDFTYMDRFISKSEQNHIKRLNKFMNSYDNARQFRANNKEYDTIIDDNILMVAEDYDVNEY